MLLILAIYLPSLALAWRWLRVDTVLRRVALALQALCFCYFLLHANERVYDLTKHLDVLRYWRSHWVMPEPRGAEYPQAQLYYLLVGKLYALLGAVLPDEDCLRLLAGMNFLFYTVFLIYGTFLLRLPGAQGWPLLLCCVALWAWPSGMIHASRITNDVPLYMGFAGSAYHLLRWRQRGEWRQLGWGLAWLGVAMGSKTSAGLLIIVLALVMAHDSLRKRPLPKLTAEQWRRIWPALALLAMGFALGYGRNMYYSLLNGGGLMQNQFVPEWHIVPEQFLTIRFESFLTVPYAQEWDDNQHFWHFLLYTLSYGEFVWRGTAHAIAMNLLLLGMAAWLALYSLVQGACRRLPQGMGLCWVFMGVMLLGLAYVKARYAINQNMRCYVASSRKPPLENI